MIFHLMIVDDEPTIRKGLSNFIQWDTLDCVVDSTACDGAEAIELIRKNPPDIVISDIRMPSVDGISLSRFIYEEYPAIKVILLTGFADFQYAQSAIRYGVSDFLLKPTSRDKLMEAVKKAQSSIAEIRNRTVINPEDFSYLKEQCLVDLTNSQEPDPVLLERCRQYNIDIQGFYAVAFQLAEEGENQYGKQMAALKSALEKEGGNHLSYAYGSHLFIWLYQNGTRTESLEQLLKYCMELIHTMGSLYNIRLTAGISLFNHGFSSLKEAVKEAVNALNMNFYQDSLISVFKTSDKPDYFKEDLEYTLELYQFENMLKAWDFPQALKWIHMFFSRLRINLTRSFEVKNACIQIYYICSRILIKKHLVPPAPVVIDEIQSCSTVGQLEVCMIQLFEQVTGQLTNHGKILSPLNEKVIHYIHSHLEDSLSLEMLAEFVHVNPSHLSRTFKKECGENITEYINKVRIEKAKELLGSTSALAYEAAEQVGFHDPAYFSTIFKKYTGLSPKEYKQSLDN